MKPRGLFLVSLASAALGSALSCQSSGEPPSPSVALPLREALACLGSVREVDGAPSPEVVLLRDRHAVGPGIFYVDEELRAFQRDQRAVVRHLVARGFDLLGCEHTLGPIPRSPAAEDHIAVIEEARASGDDLNRWSVFQPLRYEIEFQGRLQVIGVEDPALYQADLETLSKIEKVVQARRFSEAGGPSQSELAREQARLLALIRANVAERGRLAARNLLAIMKERSSRKAILMLGASHIPAASAELAAENVRHYVFEAPSFQRRAAN
jgi:hypothetical protein